MTQDEPVSWFYGLMAERWGAFVTQAPEAPYLLEKIGQYGQPVLDLACGTGRILLPLLRAGIDVDGCDISGDMLRYCQKRAGGEGFSPRLYCQPMHAFDVPRNYKLIYICSAFNLVGSLEKGLETLKRCHARLEDGGALLLDIEAEYASPETWTLWLREPRRHLPQPWPEKGPAQVGPDGSAYFLQHRILEVDPLEQRVTRQNRLEKWQNGRLVASEENILRGMMYFKNDMLLMLTIAGFRAVSVHGGFTDRPATAEDESLVFLAVK